MKELIKKSTLSELGMGLKNKEFSSVELTTAYLEQARAMNGQTAAFITLTEEQALESAKKADELIASGKSKPLTGIPLGIKDNICTKGIKTTCASKMLEIFAQFMMPQPLPDLKNRALLL